MPTPRPQVNLDAIAAVLDRVLAHPLAGVAAELLPEAHGTLRAVRDNLPAFASGIEARAAAEVKAEARALEAEIVGGLARWVRETIRAGRGERAPRALKMKNAARKAGKRKKR
jgi:hypothetical protein